MAKKRGLGKNTIFTLGDCEWRAAALVLKRLRLTRALLEDKKVQVDIQIFFTKIYFSREFVSLVKTGAQTVGPIYSVYR